MEYVGVRTVKIQGRLVLHFIIFGHLLVQWFSVLITLLWTMSRKLDSSMSHSCYIYMYMAALPSIHIYPCVIGEIKGVKGPSILCIHQPLTWSEKLPLTHYTVSAWVLLYFSCNGFGNSGKCIRYNNAAPSLYVNSSLTLFMFFLFWQFHLSPMSWQRRHLKAQVLPSLQASTFSGQIPYFFD